MELVEKLKEYNGNLFVNDLDSKLEREVFKWAYNFAEEGFASDDEKEQLEMEVKRTRLCDTIAMMEDE